MPVLGDTRKMMKSLLPVYAFTMIHKMDSIAMLTVDTRAKFRWYTFYMV